MATGVNAKKATASARRIFCSRCAKIPENRMARGGVLTKRDLEHINNKKQKNTNTTSTKGQTEQDRERFGNVLKKI